MPAHLSSPVTLSPQVSVHSLDSLPLSSATAAASASSPYLLLSRLFTLILLSSLLGLESRTRHFHLGVRSLTLLSVCSALLPELLPLPGPVYLFLPLLPAVLVHVRFRHPRKTLLVLLVSAMGVAAAASHTLVSALAYLVSLALLRDRSVARAARVSDAARVSSGSV